MDRVMGIANELVNDIRIERRWSQEHLAEACGYSRQQTAKYCVGEATPTSEFLSRLFELTHDLRIPRLVCGRAAVELRLIDPVVLKELSDPATLRALIAQRREQIDAEQALLDLLDGGIDPRDPEEHARLAAFNQEFDQAVSAQHALRQAVNDLYASRMKGGGARVSGLGFRAPSPRPPAPSPRPRSRSIPMGNIA